MDVYGFSGILIPGKKVKTLFGCLTLGEMAWQARNNRGRAELSLCFVLTCDEEGPQLFFFADLRSEKRAMRYSTCGG